MTCRFSFCLLFFALAGRAYAQPPVPPGVEPGESYHLMFVTLQPLFVDTFEFVPPFLPGFGGLDAADWAVTFFASQASLIDNWNQTDILYTSVLSTQAMPAVDRLDIQAPIYNTHGDLIATGEADLWDGSIANPVGYDEFGNAVSEGTKVWSGSFEQGIWSGNSCGDWNNPSGTGSLGDASESGSGWLFFGAQSCSQTARLYGISPLLTVPDSADFNGDDVVDGSDFLTWQQNAGTVGPLATHANGDANGDDQINDADLAVWEAQYGSPPPLAAATVTIPEPSSATLLVTALAGLLSKRRPRRTSP